MSLGTADELIIEEYHFYHLCTKFIQHFSVKLTSISAGNSLIILGRKFFCNFLIEFCVNVKLVF
jgi:hypothetical protein